MDDDVPDLKADRDSWRRLADLTRERAEQAEAERDRLRAVVDRIRRADKLMSQCTDIDDALDHHRDRENAIGELLAMTDEDSDG